MSGSSCRVIVRVGSRKLVRDVSLNASRAGASPEDLLDEACRGVAGPPDKRRSMAVEVDVPAKD